MEAESISFIQRELIHFYGELFKSEIHFFGWLILFSMIGAGFKLMGDFLIRLIHGHPPPSSQCTCHSSPAHQACHDAAGGGHALAPEGVTQRVNGPRADAGESSGAVTRIGALYKSS